MADDQGKFSSKETGECSDSTVEINVKTLDSQIYTFRINKNTPIPSLKAEVATASGVPVEQQRLIFRGKVLKDDHCLSDYHLEDGHTLHLVAREPIQAQTQPGTLSGDSSHINDNQGNNPSSNMPHSRIGQVSHSVVLGTVNIADQGEGMPSDISRVVGAVLQSLGAGILTPAGTNITPSTANQAPSSSGTEGSRNVTGRTQLGDQGQPPIPLINQPFQPHLASTGVVSPNLVIPDSLRTLLDFMNRMELILQRSGSQSSALSNMQSPPRSDTTSFNLNRLPTPEALGSVIQHAQHLLSGNAAAAFSRMAERLRREANSSDPMVRSQIQSDAMQMGLVMQHLGAMLLELGRTTMMLRMGSSPDESFVNAGSAVYISPTGPNPIMVQPSYPQMGSLFTAPSPLISGPSNPLVGGDLLRNINIHILSGTSLAPGVSSSGARMNSGDADHSDRQNVEQTRQNGSGSGPSGNAAPTRGMPARTVVAAIPAHSSGETGSHVLSVVYPVQMMSQQSNPMHAASSHGSNSYTSSAVQLGASAAAPQSSESGSVPPIVVQVNAHNDGASSNALDQASSTLLSTAAQGSHSATDELNFQPPVSSGMQASLAVRPIREEITNQILQNSIPSQSLSGTVGLQQVTTGSFSNSTSQNAAINQTDNVPNSANKLLESHISEIPTQHDGNQETLTDAVMGGSCNPRETLSTELEKSTAASHESSSSKTSSKSTPLGLGLGGLQPKRRSKSMKPVVKDELSNDSPSVSQTQESIERGQQFLRSLASQGSDTNRDIANISSTPFPSFLSQLVDGISLGGQGSRQQEDTGEMVSHVLQNPAFDNILTNMAEQTGLGSPATLRSMMEQCTQNPAMRSTLNSVAQQLEGQDLGSMLGSGRGEGGIDFSRMIQQMMPMVSQAIGRMSSRAPPVSVSGSGHQPPRNSMNNNDEMHERKFQSSQIDLHEAQQRIEQCDSPGSIFRTMLQSSSSLYGEENSYKDLVQELGDDSELSNEYLEMLHHDIRKRLDKESKSEE
ncbi:large proline-rich protein BAG6 isoform X2 [Canna indica]|uniref:Large proline-rich protein BAG6 isoform X2 n=1 Tax=Canna indica TaxID=4628 RepID=A0AAQ3KX97_9LILI|nr:large proline-rich protein BAG6 isoform X2 [Canna indica]